VLMFVGWAISSYQNLQPFFATLHLAMAAIMLTQYIANFQLTLTPEVSQQIDEGFAKPDDFAAMWRSVARFPLRDFFWLTLAIGTSVAIVVEHRRAFEMSVQRGRGDWWQDAAEQLQAKLVDIQNPQHSIYRFSNTKIRKTQE
jgi:hypothetical protein